ncbi:hypothetical protein EG866_15930, partial [Enterococcus faecalis]
HGRRPGGRPGRGDARARDGGPAAAHPRHERPRAEPGDARAARAARRRAAHAGAGGAAARRRAERPLHAAARAARRLCHAGPGGGPARAHHGHARARHGGRGAVAAG